MQTAGVGNPAEVVEDHAQDPLLAGVVRVDAVQAGHGRRVPPGRGLEVDQRRAPGHEIVDLVHHLEQQIGQLGDPSASAREQAMEAMSETLTQEPLTRRLGDALQRSERDCFMPTRWAPSVSHKTHSRLTRTPLAHQECCDKP